MCSMTLTEIAWAQTLDLRQHVLGWTADPVPGDENAETMHLAVLDAQHTPLGVVSACPHPCPERPGAAATYLWGMAVAENRQGQGIGSRLLSELARRSVAAERTVLWADARSSAVGFYVAAGATVVGDAYRDPVTGLTDRRIIFDLLPDQDHRERPTASARTC